MNFKNSFWIIPFLSFWCGYQLLSFFLSSPHVEAPEVIGKSLPDVLQILSHIPLNPRILQQKEIPDIPEGVVLSQQPMPGQKMRSHASLFLVISKKPTAAVAPIVHGKMEQEIQEILQQQNLRFKTFYLPSDLPRGTCIGQIPPAGLPVDDRKLTVYISAGNQQPLMFPELRGINVEEICRFFNEQGIKSPHIVHTSAVSMNHTCAHCIVVEQKPLAWSLVDIDHFPAIHLKVSLKKN